MKTTIICNQRVETPWDEEITPEQYDAMNAQGLPVLKFNGKCYLHVVHDFAAGVEYEVDEGLAQRLVDEYGYASRK